MKALSLAVAASCANLALCTLAAAQSNEQARQTLATTGASTIGYDATALQERLGLRGWATPFPAFGATATGDIGGFRSKLAEYDIGFLGWNTTISSINLDNGGAYPSSQRQYWGQEADILTNTNLFFTYDPQALGIEGGQFSLGLQAAASSWQDYTTSRISMIELAYSQQFFNDALEVKVGYVAGGNEWMGLYVGGNIANPFGASASMPYMLGMAQSPSTQPSIRAKWQIDDNWYAQVGAMRSLGINGPTGNIFLDDKHYNSSGFRFSVPNGRLLTMGEVGYKQAATPDSHSLWVRAGGLYNNSSFRDLETGGTDDGVAGGYVLADYQLYQADASSPATAYRGLYLGGTFMYTSPKTNALTSYTEARIYGLGLLDSRPEDQITFIYSHNGYSKYLVDGINSGSSTTGVFAGRGANSYSLSYTAKVSQGFYFTTGLQYVDQPSLTHARDQGGALNLVLGAFTMF